MQNEFADLSVTLSAELFEHFRSESRRLDVPLEWLIASLIVDTMDEDDALFEPIA